MNPRERPREIESLEARLAILRRQEEEASSSQPSHPDALHDWSVRVAPKTGTEVFEYLKAVLMEALSVDEDEITLEAGLVNDLGAESIDFLDIVFRTERRFGVRINRGELFPEAIFNDPRYAQDGRINEQGWAELQRRLPYLHMGEYGSYSTSVGDFYNLYQVDDLVRFVCYRLGIAA